MNAKTLRKLPKGADLSHIHPDMHVLAVPITALSGHPDNPRKHPDANKKAIAGSLRKYLQRESVVVNLTPEGLRIEAGHGVYGEMLAAGSQYIACTIVEDDPVTELGFMLADNRSGDLSEDDPEKLAPILQQLIEAGEDVEEIGWDDDAVRELLGDEEEDHGGDDSSPDDDTPVNRADELQKEWSTARGQVWEIPSKTVPGKCHRVVCGDSLDEATLRSSIGGNLVQMVFTDPPYNCADEMDTGFYANANSPAMRALSDTEWDKGFNIDKFLAALTLILPVDVSVYICTSHMLAPKIWAWAEHGKAKHSSYCVWCKPNPMPSLAKRYWTWATELICYAAWGKHVFNFPEEGHALSWWPINKNSVNDLHTTQKPIDVPTHAIRHSSEPGGVVADFFLGSGTTLIAAERVGRVCVGVELSEAYVAVILERARAAGLEPRLVNGL